MVRSEICLTMKEIDRLKTIQAVVDGHLTASIAAGRLGLSTRQVYRLVDRYRASGPLGLRSRLVGRASNHQLPAGVKEQAYQLIAMHYPDFGPTLACEKLAEQHGINLAKETIRQMMIASGLWLPRRQRAPKVQQPRVRRACLGELVQIDGCDHRWFEERGPACTAMLRAVSWPCVLSKANRHWLILKHCATTCLPTVNHKHSIAIKHLYSELTNKE